MKIYLAYFAVFFSFYILGAYATTDILRLLKGSTTPVNAPFCFCPVCRKKIALYDQLPIFSYFFNHGTCRNCESKIPPADLFLEVFLFSSMSACTLLTHFNWIGYGLCIAIYEGTKLVFLLSHGKRTDAFTKNLLLSLSNNCVLFLVLWFFFLLVRLV